VRQVLEWEAAMANRGRRGGTRDRGEHERGGDEHERRSDREHGDDPAKHAAIIERRWEGSPPPTFERYALALKQWHALPGAVVWPATDVIAQPPAGPAPNKEPKP
jgi:hypothetical protein